MTTKARLACQLLHRHQVPLIEDDVYAELYFGSQPPKPVKSFDREGLVMHCGSFSSAWRPVIPGRLGGCGVMPSKSAGSN